MDFILPKKELLLSPIGNTNDPRENKDFAFGTISMGGSNWKKVSERVSRYLRETHKLTCSSQDSDPMWGYEYSRMWSLYGGNHKGVCMLLDKREFLIENAHLVREGYFKEISYLNLKQLRSIRPAQVDLTQVEEVGFENYMSNVFIRENLDFLFFLKNSEWSSENEIRLLVNSDRKENEYCSIGKSLKHIYLGVDFDMHYFSTMINVCPDIDISRLEYTGVRLHPKLSYEATNRQEKQP